MTIAVDLGCKASKQTKQTKESPYKVRVELAQRFQRCLKTDTGGIGILHVIAHL